MKVLNEFEVQTVLGGSSLMNLLECGVSALKARASKKPLDVAAAALSCRETGGEFVDALNGFRETVTQAFSAPINSGSADITPVGSVTIAFYVESPSGGGYWDSGNSCLA